MCFTLYLQKITKGPSVWLFVLGSQAKWWAEHAQTLLFIDLCNVPDRVDHLLLVSPPGVTANPES